MMTVLKWLVITYWRVRIMKAIQIKFMGATDTKGSRLKAWAEGCPGMIESLDYGVDIEEQAYGLAMRYMVGMNWVECTLAGFGTLPSGDWVAVLS